ncbi:flippase [Natronocalculus amylovorans]|uniref:Flippase n=1 Tax=Natronocalculus amylovorans TaxID=2917812 RepID=A0AAE3K8M9_9EURY|nr:flippase [Natronocalculus amylovorans]MCL9817482.1 flippase [Natronocalculus amylovorans]
MRLGHTTIIYFISKFAGSIISFIATIYFTRLLGAEIYGYYAIILALVSWLTIIKSMGLSQAVIKRMSEDEEEADEFLVAGTLIILVIVTAISLAILYFESQVNAYIGIPATEFVILLLVATVFNDFTNSALNGTHKVHIYAPLSALRKAGRNVIMVGLVAIGWGLSGMLVGYAVGTIVISLLGLWYVKISFVRPTKRHIYSLINFAKYAWLGRVDKKTFSNMDIIVLGLFVPANLTGIYAVSYTVATFLSLFAAAISTTLFPEMSKLSAQNNLEQISSLTKKAITYSGLLLIPGIVGAAVVGDWILQIYGSEFSAGWHVLVILIVGVTIYNYKKQINNVLAAIDRPDLTFKINFIFIVSNVLLNIILVWRIGWIGAAIATTVSAVIGFLIAYHYLNKNVHIKIPYTNIAYQCISALVMGGFVYFFRYLGETFFIEAYSVSFVLLLVAAGAIIYIAFLSLISKQFRTIIKNNISI